MGDLWLHLWLISRFVDARSEKEFHIMTYIDCYVAAVPRSNRDAFVSHAEQAGDVFKAHGAIEYRECWGVSVPDGERTSFPKAVQKEQGEDVIIGWAVWPSKSHRDSQMPNVMEALNQMGAGADMPFDAARMIFGGFETVVER